MHKSVLGYLHNMVIFSCKFIFSYFVHDYLFLLLLQFQHLMNEWLSEKSLDGVPPPPPPPPVQSSKIEPLEVQVEEDTMYVACRPSPRNALDHMRRNSYSSVCNPYSTIATTKQSTENSIGSAKKVNCRVK